MGIYDFIKLAAMAAACHVELSYMAWREKYHLENHRTSKAGVYLGPPSKACPFCLRDDAAKCAEYKGRVEAIAGLSLPMGTIVLHKAVTKKDVN